MVELAQRILTKRPTVARVSEIAIWLDANTPTRAREPRTEITRPKAATMIDLGVVKGFLTMASAAGQRVKQGGSRIGQIRGIASGINRWFTKDGSRAEYVADLAPS